MCRSGETQRRQHNTTNKAGTGSSLLFTDPREKGAGNLTGPTGTGSCGDQGEWSKRERWRDLGVKGFAGEQVFTHTGFLRGVWIGRVRANRPVFYAAMLWLTGGHCSISGQCIWSSRLYLSPVGWWSPGTDCTRQILESNHLRNQVELENWKLSQGRLSPFLGWESPADIQDECRATTLCCKYSLQMG